MSAELPTPSNRQEEYLEAVERRVRRANAAVLSRVIGVQIAWSVSLVCGAGVALVQLWGVIDTSGSPGPQWTSAILGFVIVVAQGADKLFARTSGVVRADDEMRRNMARELRWFRAGAGPYLGSDDPFSQFADRAEAELARHDHHVADYSANLLRGTD